MPIANIILRYKSAEGELRECVVQRERVVHLCRVLEAKGFIIIGTEELI
jgi:hypothetical protein